MNFRNTQTDYGLTSKLLHWLLAIAIIVLVPLGWYVSGLSNETVQYWRLLELHEALGLLVFILFIFKLGWKFISPNPPYISELAPWERLLAHAVHSFFLLSFVLIPITGYILIASEGDPVDLYGLISLPALERISKSTSDLLFDIHMYVAYSCAVLAMVHMLAAFKHHFIDKNSVLRRMTF